MDIESKILGLLPRQAHPSMPSALRRWTEYSGCLAPRRNVPTDQQPSRYTCLAWDCTELFRKVERKGLQVFWKSLQLISMLISADL